MSKSKFGKYGDFTNLRDYILDVYTEPTPGTPFNPPNVQLSQEIIYNNSLLNGVIGLSGISGVPNLSGFPSIQELNELREELNELRSGISILSEEYYFFQKNEWFGRKIIKDYNYENIYIYINKNKNKNKYESVSGKVDENFTEILQFLIAQFIKRNNPISIFDYSKVPDTKLNSHYIEINNPPINKKFKLYFPTKINLKLNETEKIIEKTMEVAPGHMLTYPYYRITVTTNVTNGTIRFLDITINKDVEIVEQNGGNREYYGTYRYIFELSYLDV